MSTIWHWSYNNGHRNPTVKPPYNMRLQLAHLMDMAESDAMEKAMRDGFDYVTAVGIYFGAFSVEIPFHMWKDSPENNRYLVAGEISPVLAVDAKASRNANMVSVLHNSMLSARQHDFFKGIAL